MTVPDATPLLQQLSSLTRGALSAFQTLLAETDETQLTNPDEIRGVLAKFRIHIRQQMDTLAQLAPALKAIYTVDPRFRAMAGENAAVHHIDTTTDYEHVAQLGQKCIERLSSMLEDAKWASYGDDL
jgi:hypothetical protein